MFWGLADTHGFGHCVLSDSEGFGASHLFLLSFSLGVLAGSVYNWAGVHHLIGGPIPVWLISAGIVASVMMVVPVVVVGINHHVSVVGLPCSVATVRHCDSWFRFDLLHVADLVGSLMALRSVNEITHLHISRWDTLTTASTLLHHDYVWWHLLHATAITKA